MGEKPIEGVGTGIVDLGPEGPEIPVVVVVVLAVVSAIGSGFGLLLARKANRERHAAAGIEHARARADS